MSWHIVKLADVAPSPWRNGGGMTRELVAWPNADAGHTAHSAHTGQDWAWRLSVAEVSQNGPFSRLGGIERWLTVLSGEGVRLYFETEPTVYALTTSSPPFCFAGAANVQCELIAGPTQDFNLMVRTKSGGANPAKQAEVQRVRGTYSQELTELEMIAIYAIDSPATLQLNQTTHQLPAQCLAWCKPPNGATLQVTAANALWMKIDS